MKESGYTFQRWYLLTGQEAYKQEEKFVELWQYYKNSGHINSEVACWNQLALCYQFQRKFNLALEALSNAHELASETSNTEQRINVLITQSMVESSLEQWGKSKFLNEEVYLLTKATGDLKNLLFSTCQLAAVWSFSKNYDLAEMRLKEAEQLIQRETDEQLKYYWMIVIGKIYTNKYERESDAFYWLEQALDYGQKSGEVAYEIMWVRDIGFWYLLRGEYRKSLAYYMKTLELSIAEGSTYDEALSYHNIATWFRAFEDYRLSCSYFEKAFDTYLKFFPREHPKVQFVQTMIDQMRNVAEYFEQVNQQQLE